MTRKDKGLKRRNKKLQNPKKSDTKSKQSFEQNPEEEEEHDLTQMPSILQFFGYAFCPGNCVFGPWVKYTEVIMASCFGKCKLELISCHPSF